MELKKDWEIKTFEDCIENIKYTTKIPSKDYRQEGQYPIVSQEEELVSGYWDNENDLFNLTKPVVIFGDHTRVLKYVDFDFVLGADGVKILQPKDFLDTKFFMYLLKNANIKHLGYARHYRLLKELNILVPPLEEQKRIVKILDEKFAQLESLKAASQTNMQNAKELFQAELTKAFNNNTWEKKRLGEIITVLTDFNANGSYAKLDSNVKMYDKPNYAIIVRTTDLERNDFEHGVKYVDKKAYEMLSKSVIYGNEIIMNKIGSAGKIYLMPCLNRPATLARNAFLLRFNELSDVRYIFSYLQSAEGFASIMKHVHGAVTKTITKDEVRSIEIPLPPLSEQQEIVAHLDALQEKIRQLEENYTKQIAKCDELKQSFLKKAFEGEL